MNKHTPYFHRFEALGAKFKDRSGFATVDYFTSIEEEHRATREAVGMFDVFNEVCVEVKGRDAETLLGRLMTIDVRQMRDGEVKYGLMCNDEGGIFEELLCFKFNAQRFWLTPTPSRVDEVTAFVDGYAQDLSASVTNLGYSNAYLSVQGPRSRELLGTLADIDLSSKALPFCRFTQGVVAGVPKVMVSRSGYSGELGYELFFPVEYAEHVWDAVAAAGEPLGARPCGMKTMRSLRIEKMFLLYGLDISAARDPFAAGLGSVVRLDDRRFVGCSALERLANAEVKERLCLLKTDGEHSIATGDQVLAANEPVGVVTSADHGYTVGATLALAYLPSTLAVPGATVEITSKSSPGEKASAVVHLEALYDPRARRVRE